jgi:2-polyprenyl-3-methyl-5-hydroxy-6-metoxy-1,4-benzoquinol methylase
MTADTALRPMTSKELADIPVGHYHRVMESGHPVRRAWHLLKFTRVLDLCNEGPGPLLDVGCFAGSLLSRAEEAQFPRQLGVDILPEQVAFANASFGTPFRKFEAIGKLSALRRIEGGYDYATCVEVIEHLEPKEIRTLFVEVARLLTPGRGRFVLSTPNYTSTWPVLELLLNRLSDVDYSEQHITRFTWFGLERQLKDIVPELDKYFTFEVKTTTHLVSPFLAVFGVETATKVGSLVPHSRWGSPFGNLVLVRLLRNGRPFDEPAGLGLE